MPSPNYSVVFWAPPISAEVEITVGKVVIPDEDDVSTWVIATTANRNGRRSEGICVSDTGGSGHGRFEIIEAGTIDATTSGLAAGTASLVRCSATGTIERIAVASVDPDTDDIIGFAEADGRVHLYFGFPVAQMIDIIIAAAGQPADPTKTFQYNNAGAFGAAPLTYEGSGEIRAEKTTYQTVTDEAGTGQTTVWERAEYPGDAVYSQGELLTFGGRSPALPISTATWDASKPLGVDFQAKEWFLFQTGISSDTDYASMLGFQAIPATSQTGTGWMVYPNLIVSGSFGPLATSKANRFGNGTGVLCLEAAAVNPSTNTSGNIALYSDAGNSHYLTYRHPGGTAVPINTLTNVGGGNELVKAKSGINYDVRSLVAGTGISLTQNTNDVTIASTVSAGATIFGDDLAHLWLSEYSSGTWTDEAGSEDTSVVSGRGTPPSGTINRHTYPNFRASPDFDTLTTGGPMATLYGSNSYCFFGCFRLDSGGNLMVGESLRLLAEITSLGGGNSGLSITINNGSGGDSIAGTTVISDGEWHRWILNVDAGAATLYLDGNIEGTSTFTALHSTPGSNEWQFNETGYFDGGITAVGIATRAATREEVFHLDAALAAWVTEAAAEITGTDTRVAFFDGTTIGEDAGFSYNKTTNVATLTGGLDTPIVNASSSLELQGGGDTKVTINPSGEVVSFALPVGGSTAANSPFLLKSTSIALTGNKTLSNTEYIYPRITFTGTGAPYNVLFPDKDGAIWFITSTQSDTLYLLRADGGGTGTTVNPNEAVIIGYDSSIGDIIRFAP